MSDHAKRIATKVTAWTSWLASFAATAYIVHLPIMHPHRQYGVGIVLLIGIAIAAGLACSRHKLSDTIVAALKTGYDLSEEAARRRVEESEHIARARHVEAMGEARDEVARQTEERARVHARDDKEDE
jgi:hypothetical protein